MARYEAGETLASIARTYDCSPPAISYVVSRSRARHSGVPSVPNPAGAAEPQLIKTAASEAAAPVARQPGIGTPAPPVAAPNGHALADPSGRRDGEPPRPANGGAGENQMRPGNPAPPVGAPGWQKPLAPAAHAGGDQRRTLHLSLGHPASDGNGPAPPAQPAERPAFANRGHPAPAAPNPAYRGYNDGTANASGDVRPAAYEPLRHDSGAAAHRKEGGGAFIDRELRTRVEADIAAFLAAFDAALAQDSPESRSALREATDRLLRAGARTRIELERLEARLPLPARDHGGRGEPAWRQR